MLWKNGLKTRPLRLSPGGRREICLQVRVWPRGLVLHGVSWQSAAGAENWHGAADQRGGHGAAVALWRKHGIRTGGTLLPAAPLQRGLRLLTSAPQNPHLHPTLLPAASIRTHETVVSSNSQPLGELDWTHMQRRFPSPLSQTRTRPFALVFLTAQQDGECTLWTGMARC